MKIAVRYFSRGGNTKKLADAIADAVGVTAETTDVPLTEDVDILFLGSSVYAFNVDDHVKDFIEGIDVTIGKVVGFSTAALDYRSDIEAGLVTLGILFQSLDIDA